MIRCGKHPRVLFEVVSPSELQHKRQRDQRRLDLQAIEGVQEIIEIYQDEMLVHASRRQDAGWMFDSIAGPEAEVTLPSVGIAIPLPALFGCVLLEQEWSGSAEQRHGRNAHAGQQRRLQHAVAADPFLRRMVVGFGLPANRDFSR